MTITHHQRQALLAIEAGVKRSGQLAGIARSVLFALVDKGLVHISLTDSGTQALNLIRQQRVAWSDQREIKL